MCLNKSGEEKERHPLIKIATKGTISKLNFITQQLKISGDMLVFLVGGSTYVEI